MTKLINIKGEEITTGCFVMDIITEKKGIILDIILTDRGYAVKLENGNIDYAHRFILTDKK